MDNVTGELEATHKALAEANETIHRLAERNDVLMILAATDCIDMEMGMMWLMRIDADASSAEDCIADMRKEKPYLFK